MAQYNAVSASRHRDKTWHKVTGSGVTTEERTAPLIAREFSRAAITFPIAWVANNAQFDPVGLLGLVESENLFVDSRGRWVGAYCPVHIRTQPFRLLSTQDDQLTLGVREDLGLVTDDRSGYPFFNTEEELSAELQAMVEWLHEIEGNRAATQRASQALDEADLLIPWNISPTVYGEPKKLDGLYRVSQERLNKLDAHTLLHLKDTGALAMAYCQKISEQLIRRLETLHERRANGRVHRSSHPLDKYQFGMDFEGPEGSISFGGIA